MQILEKIKNNTILYAGYGYGDKVIDVTEKIKKSYKEGKRKIKGENGISGDPFVGKVKSFFMVWTENGTTKSAVVAEGEEINLPNNLLIAD